MQGLHRECTGHPQRPGQANHPPDHSHPHRARMPPPPGGARRQHTHRARTIPLAKGLSTRLPSPPATPTGRSDYTPGEGLPRWPGGAVPRPRRAGRGGGTGWAGRRTPPASSAWPAPLEPSPPGDPGPTRPAGRPPRRPLQPRAAPAPGSRSRPPHGLRREPGRARYLRSPWRRRRRRRVRTARGGDSAGGADGRAAPQPRCLAAAGGSGAQRSAAAARLRTEHASGRGGAASAPLRSPARP